MVTDDFLLLKILTIYAIGLSSAKFQQIAMPPEAIFMTFDLAHQTKNISVLREQMV